MKSMIYIQTLNIFRSYSDSIVPTNIFNECFMNVIEFKVKIFVSRNVWKCYKSNELHLHTYNKKCKIPK